MIKHFENDNMLPAGLDVTWEREEGAKPFNLSRLPDQAGETVRIIRIGDYDACPCIGEHKGG